MRYLFHILAIIWCIVTIVATYFKL